MRPVFYAFLRRKWFTLAIASTMVWLTARHDTALAQSTPPAGSADCLILYDSAGEWGWVGMLHAKMLANLLGHFPLGFTIAPVENYQPGDAGKFRNLFYFGNTYDNPLPGAFLQDVMTTTNPVCWFQYNLWQLSDSAAYRTTFRSKFGFRFDALDSSGYSNITYKAELFPKSQLDPELGRVTILNSNVPHAAAVAWRGDSSNAIPYIIRGSNFWYVADAPFSYISEEDRYLVFADILHDVVQIPHAEKHRAIIRLEDVNATYPTNLLCRAADFLAAEGVPFAVSVVPLYRDPLGEFTGGVPEEIALADVPEFVAALQYMKSKGGQIIMHGYTHQYDTIPNPYAGVTGADYEFFRVTVNEAGEFTTFAPVPEDSIQWVNERVSSGLSDLTSAGLPPVAWETPHYAASALDYAVFASLFPLTIQRVLYFDDAGRNVGQFFPYVIERDVYGQKIMPENLGNIDPDAWEGYPARLPADLLRAATKNRVIRDGWASAYFHPYLDLAYLEELVRGVKALGYTYVPVADGPVNLGLTCSMGGDGVLRLRFNSEAAVPYVVETSTNVLSNSWSPFTTRNGTGSHLEVDCGAASESKRFYRVRVE